MSGANDMSDRGPARPGAGASAPAGPVQPCQWPARGAGGEMLETPAVIRELRERFPDLALTEQPTADGIPTAWLPAERALEVLGYLGREAPQPFAMLYDLGGVDERERLHREGLPEAAFSVFYHLVSYGRNADLRLKVALPADGPRVDSVAGVWPAADWYERELWEMFGVDVAGHDRLRRLITPSWWEGHPLRKEHPSRGTEYGPFELPDQLVDEMQEHLRFKPEEWGLPRPEDDPTLMYLNIGPQHGATHGPFRVVVGLRDEEIVHLVPDIGYHHRGSEKLAERQSWHTYIPYTDRVDYLGGVTNNLPYVLTVEKLCGIEVPDRAQLIRVLLCECFRIASHLVFYGTYAQDIGALSPVFYMFRDREILLDEVIEPITGGRMHPNWFRIGGVAEDLPRGWRQRVLDFCDYLPPRLDEYERLLMENSVVRARMVDVAPISVDDAVAWGLTGPMLRAAGLPWDWRKQRPYSHYDWFDFDVPVGTTGDCYDRAAVRRGDAPEPAHHASGGGRPAGRPVQGIPSPGDPADEGAAHDAPHRVAHHPLPRRLLGARRAARRGQRVHRGHQGPVQLLRHQRRRQCGVPGQDPHGVLPPSAGPAAPLHRPWDRRSGHGARQHRLRHGGRGQMSLSDDEIRQLDGILGHYPDRRAAAATAMRLVQARRRWLSDETMADLGEYLGLTVAELDSIATFGNMIFRKPVGRHVVLVCDSFVCWSLGYAELRAAVEAQLGIRMGQTTPDRRFTLLPIVCLGACDRGPAMMVDADLYGPVDPDGVAEILRGYA